ncbi:hypothetical protein M4951_08715 [Blastopirellula sp. J2-11]|uniref:hypothetical protein n=1 Tax=Blastopirellula sp. J2-11 TaxID=2943192 RepID=UPI0021C6FA5C|nr:hypothetical protein [Blastopirellula sp. J2-11]UUO08383.1 hypothetical protein M4951_08715 [Blastopirellula sp. J2-11]
MLGLRSLRTAGGFLLLLLAPITAFADEIAISPAILEATEALRQSGASVNYYENAEGQMLFNVNFVDAAATEENLRHLVKLPHVERLWLGRSFKLNEMSWEAIMQLRELEYLYLHSQPNDDDMRQIAQLTNLRTLLIDGRNLTNIGLWYLEELRFLENLTIQNASFDGDCFHYLANVRSLTNLTLQSDKLKSSDLAGLGELPQLELLFLSVQSVDGAGFAEIGKLTHLRSLNLRNVRTTAEQMKPLAQLHELQFLTMNDSNIRGGLGAISGLHDLHRLELANSTISDADLDSLQQLPLLANLNLAHTKITDAGLVKLGQMKRLNTLNVRNTTVTKEGLQALQGRWPQLIISASINFIEPQVSPEAKLKSQNLKE